MNLPRLPTLPPLAPLARALAAAGAAVLVAGSPLLPKGALPLPTAPVMRAASSLEALPDDPALALTEALAQEIGAADLDTLYAGADELAVEYADAALRAALADLPVPSELEEETRAAVRPDRAGQVIAMKDSDHLWLAGDDGKYHWVGDSQALQGKSILWSERHVVDLSEIYDANAKGTAGDPYLSTSLIMWQGKLWLPKWEQGQAMPTLLHIPSIEDVQLFGINGGNYGRLVKQPADWEREFGRGLRVSDLAQGALPPAVRPRPAPPVVSPPPVVPAPVRPAPVVPAPVVPAPAPVAPDWTSTSYTTRQIGGITYTFVPAWLGRTGNDADLFAALILASTVSPEFRTGPASRIIGTGAAYRWGYLAPTTSGVTTVSTRAVQINSNLRGDIGGTASTMTHETHHATVIRTYGSAACFQEEADAFAWEAGVWSRLPGQYKTGASSAGNNAITSAWQRSGVAGLLSAVKSSDAYQKQCARG
jgi:hypothetical protein